MPKSNTVFAIALNLSELNAKAPDEVQLLPAGKTITGRDGRSWNNDNPQNVIDAFVTNQQKLPIDINHSTEYKSHIGEPSPAVGWINRLYLKSGETWAAVSWNQSGKDLLADKAYKYLSPVFSYDRVSNNIQQLTSVALTNQPNLFLTALNQSKSNNSTGDQPMSKLVTQALGLNDGADDASIVAAINSLKDDKAKALNSVNNPDLAKFIPKADHELVLNRAKAAEEKIATIKKDTHNITVNAAIDAAIKEGKIAPVSKKYYTTNCSTADGLKAFNSYVKDVAPIIGESGLTGKTPAGTQTSLNATEAEAAKALGLSNDEYLAKINPSKSGEK